jgi:protein gp37
MATQTKIEWTEVTWNPVTGCTKLSRGCVNCYAERLAKRLKAMGMYRYRNGFDLTLHEDLIGEPLKWRKPSMAFVNSMSDLFHEDVPLGFIQSIFETMRNCPHHVFQILTKRSSRLFELSSHIKWPQNVWMGVTVEDQDSVYRLSDLRRVPANIRFVSFEPLLGPIKDVSLDGIHWVIVGGESGPRCRPIRADWVKALLSRCRDNRIAFFFKQWGGTNKNRSGRLLGGKTYDELPCRWLGEDVKKTFVRSSQA